MNGITEYLMKRPSYVCNDEIQVLESLAAALRVQENIKATIKLEEYLTA